MADQLLSFRDFSQRLVLAGGRDTIPRNALRRCVGCAPEPEPIVKSRWGSTQRFNTPGVISLAGFSDSDWLYDGLRLWRAGLTDPSAHLVSSGYNGERVTMLKAPPALGIEEYLFIIGGGKNQKIAPDDSVSSWGITAPPSQMTAATQPQNVTTIDNFDSSAGSWTGVNCNVTNETSDDTKIYEGSGSLKVVPTAAPWRITRTFGSPANFGTYFGGAISLPTDYISFWVNITNPNNLIWLWLEFDVDPVNSDFKHNYYRAVIQVVPTTANVNAANAAVILSADADRFVQVAVAKSQFERIGTDLQYDWSAVQKIRIAGGNPTETTTSGIHFDLFTMFGGVGLGTGPAALTGGSTLQYLVTFGNSTTGNDSNPPDQPAIVTGVIDQAVVLNAVPISPDVQVTNRKLWRTSEGGALFFYLDTIPDNVTTQYIDEISSLPGQPIIVTPWQAGVAIPLSYYVDSGAGYYMKCTTAGTTGANPPNWVLPQSAWASLAVFDTLNETILPANSPGHVAFKVVQTGTTGAIEPNWSLAPLTGNQIHDGTVIWQTFGQLVTNDNTVAWTCLGLNTLPSLGTDEVRYDNIPFPASCEDAVYFAGAMLVGRETQTGKENWVYVSPPGRNEGYANILQVGSADDPVQKLVVWDEAAWVITSRYIYPLSGDPPNMAVGDRVLGAEGTSWPFTVVPSPYGIIYRGDSGIRLFNRASSELIGAMALGPIERGQTVENVTPLQPIIAELVRDEVFFSDGVETFAFSFTSRTWRMVGMGFNAIAYHDEIQTTLVATPAAVLSWEVAGVLTDVGQPIPIEWQSPSALPDPVQLALTKRIHLDIDPAGQVLTPTLLIDNQEIALPDITAASRGTIPIAWQAAGRVIGIRLTGNVVQRVTWYGVDSEARNGR